MTRALVVDDSHFMRTVITDVLETAGIEVVATASDGERAVAAAETHEPDVITMDVEMPRMNGIEAVREIMNRVPTPILMLSAHTEDGTDATFEAMNEGAVDFFAKPGGEVSTGISGHRDHLVEKIRSVAKADPSSHVQTQTETATVEPTREYVETPTVVIGASTGGPKVVESIVSRLPLDADLRLLIVQHMPGNFTERFAARLDAESEYDIREASDGDSVAGGTGLVAKGGHHMRVTDGSRGRLRVELTDGPRRHGVRPAIDATMESASATVDGALVGVVLTGMGADGAAGVRAIHEAGGHTIAQDEETASVFGIPRRAIETDCVDAVLPGDRITNGILETISQNG